MLKRLRFEQLQPRYYPRAYQLDQHLEARAGRPGLLLLLNMQGQAYSQGRGISEELASQTT
jgi:hypothetical protein